MAVYKPLELTEVPEGHQSYFRYDAQWQEPVPNQTRLKKMRTMIAARCEICEEWHSVAVNDVRNWIRGIRTQRPGTHRKCKYEGRSVRPDGYVLIWTPEHPNAYQGKYMMEHILVMEKALGRYLKSDAESVHHIDGDRSNNSLDNLQLRFRYHGKGQAWQCNSCGSNDVQPIELS